MSCVKWDDFKGARVIWWLIQVNAILWLLLLGVLAKQEPSLSNTWMAFVGLAIAAALEWAAYKGTSKNLGPLRLVKLRCPDFVL